MDDSLDLSRDDAASRYVGRLAGQHVSQIDFRLHGSSMIITHTRTDPAYRGQGLAAQITRYALDDARARGLTVVPQCPYTASYVEEHPEYADLVDPPR